MIPQSGDLLHIGVEASVQFATPILVRVIRVHTDWQTYHGWVWLDVYQLDRRTGEALTRREIFVQYAGLKHGQVDPPPVTPVPEPPADAGDRPAPANTARLALLRRRRAAVPAASRPR